VASGPAASAESTSKAISADWIPRRTGARAGRLRGRRGADVSAFCPRLERLAMLAVGSGAGTAAIRWRNSLKQHHNLELDLGHFHPAASWILRNQLHK
jgi:hypothetical protein